jgi:hypothetical protein
VAPHHPHRLTPARSRCQADSDVGEGILVGGAYGAFPPGTTVASPGDTPIGQNITIENSSAYNIAGDGDCSSCGSTPSRLWEYCQTCTLQYNE